jgi:hypothetical protein
MSEYFKRKPYGGKGGRIQRSAAPGHRRYAEELVEIVPGYFTVGGEAAETVYLKCQQLVPVVVLKEIIRRAPLKQRDENGGYAEQRKKPPCQTAYGIFADSVLTQKLILSFSTTSGCLST